MDVKIKSKNGGMITVGHIPDASEFEGKSLEEVVEGLADAMRRAAEKAYKEARAEFDAEIREFLDRDKKYLW